MIQMTARDLLDKDWERLCILSGRTRKARPLLSFASPRFAPVWILRTASALHAHGWERLAKIFSLANVILFSLESPARLVIGPGLVIADRKSVV